MGRQQNKHLVRIRDLGLIEAKHVMGSGMQGQAQQAHRRVAPAVVMEATMSVQASKEALIRFPSKEGQPTYLLIARAVKPIRAGSI